MNELRRISTFYNGPVLKSTFYTGLLCISSSLQAMEKNGIPELTEEEKTELKTRVESAVERLVDLLRALEEKTSE